ncbi:hypothetical protein V6N11_042119 [Hibiscus sabdariffa]|uniref:Uncharacterized protein n=1 Tax=Hibiscus sabdariffa TaxID=183260 RepID=A0ABR2QVW2_9ROSI
MLAYFKTFIVCSHTIFDDFLLCDQGVPYPGLPKRGKPRRVELYFSSWIIRPVESRKGDGQLYACEVTLVHYEDMGIPKDVAKLGVRHGMWGAGKMGQKRDKGGYNAIGSPNSTIKDADTGVGFSHIFLMSSPFWRIMLPTFVTGTMSRNTQWLGQPGHFSAYGLLAVVSDGSAIVATSA